MTFDGLPRNHYGAILADPPWGFKTWSGPEKSLQGQHEHPRHRSCNTQVGSSKRA
jgi:hypothetical protein